MKISELTTTSCPETNAKLVAFERLFTYPLGDSVSFSIDHGPDYTAFYRSIGEGKTIIVEVGELIVAAVSVALRHIELRGKLQKMLYIGDLKIHPEYKSGRILFHVAKYLQTALEPLANHAYGIVMNGTSVTPDQYSGRLGIPYFAPLAKLHVLRFKTLAFEKEAQFADDVAGFEVYKTLNRGSSILSLADFSLRSKIEPRWFKADDIACGMLEDTRKAKRLHLQSGQELNAAHLSYFAFLDAGGASKIIKCALSSAFSLGFPVMFLALSSSQRDSLKDVLLSLEYEETSATVFGTSLFSPELCVNTSEI